MYALLSQSKVIQKVGLVDHPQCELPAMLFYIYIESTALTAPNEIELPYCTSTLEIGATFVRLFLKTS
jgi:hypothetical protein